MKAGILGFTTALALVAGLYTSATDAADYYEGKTINLIVGNDAGSGYDAYARLTARHMSKYIPGKPAFVVRNMPGAGSVVAAQHMYAVAPKDGTSIAILFPGALLEPLTGDPAKFRYDPTRFEYIGTADSGTRLCFMMANSAVQTLEDARKQKVIIGGTAAGSSTTDYAWFLNALAGTKFEVVTGYKGPGDILLALERGEAAGICALDSGTLLTMRPDWISSGKIKVFLQAGIEANPRYSQLGVPPMQDFMSGENLAIAELIVSQQVFARPFVAPPQTSNEAMLILRAAFMATMQDQVLLEEANKMKLDINPKPGDEIAGLVKKIYASAPDIIEKMKKALRP